MNISYIIELMGILYWGLGVVLLPLGPQAGPEAVCCSSIWHSDYRAIRLMVFVADKLFCSDYRCL